MGDALSSLSTSSANQGSWRARAALIYLSSSADRLFEGSEEIDNYLNLHIKMQLLTVTAAIDSPFGLSGMAILPYLDLWHEQNFFGVNGGDPRSDSGPGDLELRLRQDLSAVMGLPKGLRWAVTLGAVLPTGVYLAATTEEQTFLAGTGTADTGSRELNIGRGVGWVIADTDLNWSATDELLLYGNAQYRQPLGEAVDGFGWGAEVRGSAGTRYAIVEKWLSCTFSVDYQQRGEATWRPFGVKEPTAAFPNGGGASWYVTPGLSTQPWDWLGLSVSYRQNVLDHVIGQQLVQNPAFFVALSGNFSFIKPQTAVVAAAVSSPLPLGEPPQVPEVAALLVAGKITIVDYWATWCAPCLKLGPRLDEFAKTRPDVVIARVEATDWGKTEWTHFLPGVAGLPVLDVFGPDGKLMARLIGEAAERFEAAVPAAAPATLPAAATPS